MTRRRWLLLSLVVVALVTACAGTLGFENVRTSDARPNAPEFGSIPTAPNPSAPEGPATVDCEMTVDPGRVSAQLTEHDPDSGSVLPAIQVWIDEGWIQFAPRFPHGLGVLSVPGYRPVAFGWTGGACLTLVDLKEIPVATITGKVRGVVDLPSAHWVTGCGRGGPVEADHTYTLTFTEEEPCDLHVFRVFGGSNLTGRPTRVTPVIGTVSRVDLDAPDLPGGPGWDLLEVDDGFRVMAVASDSPADRAGVRVGDRIVSIDEEDASEWAEEAAHELPMRIELSRDGVVRQVDVR